MYLLKRERVADPIIVHGTAPEDDEALHGIRCPRCSWKPSATSTWCCEGSGGPEPPFDWCGMAWNTFATGGRCPRCRHQWRWTSCLGCQQWSRHEDWYERQPPGPG
jgi:DNA-directed RNA polymerase subunit RPC12/RpoP